MYELEYDEIGSQGCCDTGINVPFFFFLPAFNIQYTLRCVKLRYSHITPCWPLKCKDITVSSCWLTHQMSLQWRADKKPWIGFGDKVAHQWPQWTLLHPLIHHPCVKSIHVVCIINIQFLSFLKGNKRGKRILTKVFIIHAGKGYINCNTVTVGWDQYAAAELFHCCCNMMYSLVEHILSSESKSVVNR